MMIDRCCGPYTEMKNKEFYFIATAAEEDETIMDRIVANFMGFLDCLENPTVKGTLFAAAYGMREKLREARNCRRHTKWADWYRERSGL